MLRLVNTSVLRQAIRFLAVALCVSPRQQRPETKSQDNLCNCAKEDGFDAGVVLWCFFGEEGVGT